MRRYLVFGVVLLACFVYIFANSPFRPATKWGFIDKTGNLVIAHQFDDVDADGYGGFEYPSRRPFCNFSEGLCAVKLNGKWNFIDKQGGFAITGNYDTAGAFSDGLACVRMGKKFGYIDHTGKYAIPLKFDWPGPISSDVFGQDMTAVGIAMYRFHEGLAVVRQGNNAGYIDKTGKFVIEPKYMTAYPFENGQALVHSASEPGVMKSEIIDKTGKTVFTAPGITYFSEGLCVQMVSPISDRVHVFRYLDAEGKPAFPGRFYDAREFSEGLAAVAPNPLAELSPGDNQAYGYIDTSGKMVIQPAFYIAGNNLAASFVDGRAVVSQIHTDPTGSYDNRHGIIDRTGRWVVPPKYKHIGCYRDGLARAFLDNQCVYLDHDGNVAIKSGSVWGNSFSEGLAAVH